MNESILIFFLKYYEWLFDYIYAFFYVSYIL